MITLINEQGRKFPVQWFSFHQILSIIKDSSSCKATYESPTFLGSSANVGRVGHGNCATLTPLAAPPQTLNIGPSDSRKKPLLLSACSH